MAITLAVMSFDGVSLLLPQAGVGTVEMASSVEQGQTDAPGAVGRLKSGGREWATFVLASDFSRQASQPDHYKFCVGINDENQNEAFAIACEQVGTVNIENENQLQAVEACMRTDDCPIEALMLKDNQLMLMSDVETMRRFLIPEVREV